MTTHIEPSTLESPASIAARRRPDDRLRPMLARVFGIAPFAVGTFVYFSLTTHQFLQYGNMIVLLSNMVVIGIVAIGQMFAIISGGFDLSVSGVVPLGAVLYTELSNHGISTPLAMLVVVLIGAGIGLINGVLITRFQINPLITTFGMLSVTGGLALQITNGVTIPINDIGAGVLADDSVGRVPWGVWILLGLAVASGAMLRYTTLGRSLMSIGGNREASWLAGIRVNLLSSLSYAICAAFAAFAGIVVASQLLAGAGTVGTDSALTSVAAVILGGAALTGGEGGPAGTIAGVFVLGMLADGMALMQLSTFYQQIVTGLVLLVAVGFGRLRALVTSD